MAAKEQDWRKEIESNRDTDKNRRRGIGVERKINENRQDEE